MMGLKKFEKGNDYSKPRLRVAVMIGEVSFCSVLADKAFTLFATFHNAFETKLK